MIEISHLCKSYGDRTAIEDISFSVKKGEVLGFLGPNGAGKTTTMKIITGFMAPSSGSVSVGGYDVFEHPIKVKKQIGYLPEVPPIYLDMYVRDYLEFVARLKGVAKESVTQRVNEALEKTSLGDVSSRIIQNLSKGYRQRVGLAQALVGNPDILILDEPTAGLDPKQVAEIRNLIGQLKGEHTIVLSTHILPEVQATCDRIVIINEGKIRAQDSLSALSQRFEGRVLRLRVSKEVADLDFSRIPGVHGVEKKGLNFELQVDGQEVVSEKILKQVLSSGAGLNYFNMDMGLEDIFIRLTSQGQDQNQDKVESQGKPSGGDQFQSEDKKENREIKKKKIKKSKKEPL